MRRAKRPSSRCAACFPGSTAILRGGHARGRAPWARMLPVRVSFTCCLLAPGSCFFRLRLCWMPWDRPPRAKKASPRRGPSSPPVCWHLLRWFRRSHSRHWGCLNRPAPPAAPPPAASNDETGAAARASAKAKANVLFNIYFSLCCALARQQGFNARDLGWWLSPSMPHADSSNVACNP